MNSLFENLTEYLLGQSVHIVWLFLLVGVVCVALRSKSAHLRYLLWLLIIAKCLVPSLVTISLAILPEKAEPVVEQVVHEEAAELAPEVFIDVATEYVPMPVTPVDTRPAFIQYITSLSKEELLAFGWMVGAGLFLVLIVVKAVRTNMILTKNRRALPELLQAEVNELLGTDTGAGPSCYCMDGIAQPFVWGLVRGSIYLPADFMASTDGEHRRQILMHEMAHITRRDPVVNFLQIVAQVVFFFHPLVWVANKLIRAEREKCCDEAAIARLDASPKEYGRAIVDTLVNEYESTMPTPSMAIAGPVKNIENRIKTIMQPGRKFYKRPTVVAILMILLVAAVTVPVGFALSNRPAKDPERNLKLENKGEFVKTLDDGVTVELLGICEHPSGDKQWWSPDGSLFGQSPVRDIDVGGYNIQSGKAAYELVVKLTGPETLLKRSSTPEKWKVSRAHRVGLGISGTVEDKDGVPCLRATTVIVKNSLEKIDVEFGLAGVWEKRLAISPNESSKQKIRDTGIVINPPYERNSNATITIKNPNKIDSKMRIKITAVLKNGKIAGAAWNRNGKISFMRSTDNHEFTGVNLSDVDHFEIYTSKYEWVEFKKVSLKPNKESGWITKYRGKAAGLKDLKDGSIGINHFKQEKGVVEIDFYDTYYDKYECRVIAVARGFFGKVYLGKQTSKIDSDKAVRSSKVEFTEISLRDIKEFKFQVRPLKPNYKPAVEVDGVMDDFGSNFARKVEQFDIDNADLDEVIDTFGQPLRYIWGRETYDENDLPIRYIAVYPNGFNIYISYDKVVEIRFEGQQPDDYLYLRKLKVGSSLDEVFEVIGKPEETVEGKEIGWEKNVLYKDIEGKKGYCYYHRPDNNVRIFFDNYKILALYITRSDYGSDSGRKKADIPSTSTINEEGHIVDKVDYPFVNDAEVLGGWKSVDFVDEIDSFKPAKKYWQDELYLNSLIFEKDGTIAGNLFTWTKGLVLSDTTASKYTIKEMDGSTYMFYEWKSGDYTIRHRKPLYYVFKKVPVESLKYEPMMGKKAEIPPTSTINEQGHIVDKVDYPFVNDPKVIGTWKAVDHVMEIGQFKIDEKDLKNEKHFLHEMIFEENGRLISKNDNEPGGYPGDWTKGLIIYDNDTKTASQYTLKDIDGETYMFRQWKSGDYTFRRTKPKYYVLKKVSSETGQGGDVGAFGGIKQLWEKVFYELYRLEDGEDLKRIAPPFIPERKDYYHDRHTSQAKSIPEPPDYFTFHWDGELKNWGLGSGGGASSLNNVLSASLSIPDDQFEGPEKLLKLPVGGDWIVRKNVSDAEKLRALEKILLEELGEKISFQKRKVAREVIVAKGKFKFSRPSGTYDDRRVHFYSDKLDPRVTGVGKANTVADLINVLGQRTGLQIIDETRSSSKKINLRYGHHRSSRLSFVNTQAKNSTKLKMMLKNLEEQTNLKFTVEERTVSKWIVTGDGYENSTAVIGSLGGGMGGFGGIDPENPLSFQPGQDPTEGKMQIAIETRILIVDENFLEDIGMDINVRAKAEGKPPLDTALVGAEGEPLGRSLDDQEVKFMIRATQMHANSKTLTAPKIVVLDKEIGRISVVKDYNYISDYTEPVSAGGEPEAVTETFSTGIDIEITPTITEDNKYVIMKIDFEYSNVFDRLKLMYKDKYPYEQLQTETTKIKSHVVVPDRGTILLGGMKITASREVETGVPILKDIPILDRFFSSRSEVKDRQVLLMLVKPTIIKGATLQANPVPLVEVVRGAI